MSRWGDAQQIVGRERRERVSHHDWSGDACLNSRRRVNGLDFDKLGPDEYLVSIGCAANEWLFMYYRERNPVVARLLRFPEYDAAHHTAAIAYSKVNSVTHGFD